MFNNNFKKSLTIILLLSVFVSAITGGLVGFMAGVLSNNSNLSNLISEKIFGNKNNSLDEIFDKKIVKIDEESAIVSTVEKASPAVVSIIVSKDLPVIERYYTDSSRTNDFFSNFFGNGFGNFFEFNQPQYRQNGTEKKEIGGGSGFLISSDGYVVTNKHVILDEEAEYTVLMNDESKHEAKVLARDTATDLAILKIEGNDFPTLELGDSSDMKVGQSVIAIGNALGEFRNTVSTGVVSGLSRSVTAGLSGFGSEELSGVIQTDASINPGNSGGPLLNIAGQVVGINTAIAQGAQNIGFAIPINEVKNSIESVKKDGKIIRPWLGVRYIQINKKIKEANKLDVDYGALVARGENLTDLAVMPGSPADKAGIVENDIILEIDGKQINEENNLLKVISKYNVGDEIKLKVLHKGKEKEIKIKLEEVKN